jgi:hypothetical protein
MGPAEPLAKSHRVILLLCCFSAIKIRNSAEPMWARPYGFTDVDESVAAEA